MLLLSVPDIRHTPVSSPGPFRHVLRRGRCSAFRRRQRWLARALDLGSARTGGLSSRDTVRQFWGWRLGSGLELGRGR